MKFTPKNLLLYHSSGSLSPIASFLSNCCIRIIHYHGSTCGRTTKSGTLRAAGVFRKRLTDRKLFSPHCSRDFLLEKKSPLCARISQTRQMRKTRKKRQTRHDLHYNYYYCCCCYYYSSSHYYYHYYYFLFLFILVLVLDNVAVVLVVLVVSVVLLVLFCWCCSVGVIIGVVAVALAIAISCLSSLVKLRVHFIFTAEDINKTFFHREKVLCVMYPHVYIYICIYICIYVCPSLLRYVYCDMYIYKYLYSYYVSLLFCIKLYP